MTILLVTLLVITWWADTYIKEEPTVRQATAHVAFVNFMAGSWAMALALFRGVKQAGAFLMGYAAEWVLSLDNLMAIALVFAYFTLPMRYELKILRYGIASVAVFRLAFTLVGASVLQAWEHPAEIVFGTVIAYTAVKMMRAIGEEQHAEMVDHNSRWYIRALRRWIPITGDATTPVFFKKKFERAGPDTHYHVYRTYATPLLACLVAVEATDIVFSLDSAPVVVAVAQDPLIIYSAMMFAVIGLRSLYFLIQAVQHRTTWLPSVVIGVLLFIALRLLAHGLLNMDVTWMAIPLVIAALIWGLPRKYKEKDHAESETDG